MPGPSVVLDTNVVVSAHLNAEGLERFVLDLALVRKLQLFVSSDILEEYADVLAREKFGISPERVAESLLLIKKSSKIIQPKRPVEAAKDPDDNKFLECAIQANAGFLVTGNKRHFPPRWGQTRVVNARELVEELIPGLKS